MSDLSTTPGQLRVGDAERDRVTELLAEHHAAGRLTATELDQRLTAALAARTRDDLGAPLADLPATPRTPPPAPVANRPLSAEAIGWRAHLASYVAVILGLWLVWAVTGFGHPWPIWPMLGWGMGLVGHRTQASLCARGGTTSLGPPGRAR